MLIRCYITIEYEKAFYIKSNLYSAANNSGFTVALTIEQRKLFLEGVSISNILALSGRSRGGELNFSK
ncbi:MAG: hypothetical protein ACJAS1_003444 [Oleiphilaceae bacterium]|jgi:hypothetical protein